MCICMYIHIYTYTYIYIYIDYTTIVEVGLKHHSKNGLLGPNSIMVAHMDPRVNELSKEFPDIALSFR